MVRAGLARISRRACRPRCTGGPTGVPPPACMTRGGDHERPDRMSEVHPWVAEARLRPRFAIVGTFLPEWAQVRDFAVRAEELGFDAYWANDHPLRAMDCWTQLAALATVTTRLRLIALVSCVYYRSPVLI